MNKVKFTILGEPAGKGRPRSSVFNGKIVVRTPKETVLYENLVRTEYRRQVGNFKFDDGQPLDLRVMAYYGIPKSVSKKKRQQMIDGLYRPTKKPDADNIIKAIADSLNNIAYKDDSQLADVQIRKFYSSNPRVEVIVQPVTYERS